MSDKTKVEQEKPGFSLKPDVLVKEAHSEYSVVDEKQSNRYIALESMSQGRIFYVPKLNQFFTGEGNIPVDEKVFNEKFLPYLKWKYDQVEEVVNEVKVKEGSKTVTKKVNTGQFINKFPCTPENIAAKRKELIGAAVERGEIPNADDIHQMTSPHTLTNDEQTEALLKKPAVNLQMINRLKN